MRRRVIAFSAALVILGGLSALPLATSSVAQASTTERAGSPDPAAPHRARTERRAPQVSRDAARQQVADDEPLAVTLDQLTPSTIPARGDIQVSGSVTNTDDQTWTTVKVYPFVSAEPMTTAAELDAASSSEPDAVVGERVDPEGTHNATIESLAPGQSVDYSFSVPRGLLDATTPGVYWFGVQALGQGPDGRDLEADGRARTFLPLVPQRAIGTLPVSVVLPLRRPIGYADDGSVSDPDGWLASLSDGGRLRSLVDLGGEAGGQPLSWLIDPALVDAVRRLAAGNPPRSLAPNLAPGDGTDPDATASPGASGSTGATATPSPDTGSEQGATTTDNADVVTTDGQPRPLTRAQLARADADTRTLAQAAQDWLSRLTDAIRPGDELLVLPYGDTDVSAAADHDARAYQVARARADGAAVLPGLDGVQVAPAVGSPSGYLDPSALGLVDPGTTTLVTDQMFTDPPGTLAQTAGHDVVVTSTAAASGGPGPDDPTAPTAMRQRLLAQATVRFLADDPQPLVALLPQDWNPVDAAGFFTGLRTAWVTGSTVSDATSAVAPTIVDATGLHYPNSQREAQLDAANFQAASRLTASGAALQSLLTLNNLISGTVRDEALTSLSYAARTHPDTNRVADDRSRSWIAGQLGRVTVSAPTAVNLLSSTGRFNSTVHNGLDQPVTVALDARTDGGLRVTGPRRVRVAAGGIASVPLGARTDETGVHQVMLQVTDQRGVPLGSTAELSVRSSQVSGVIWLFIAVGAALLFGTIAVRLFRRIRGARRDATGAAARRTPAPATSPAEPRPAPAGRP